MTAETGQSCSVDVKAKGRKGDHLSIKTASFTDVYYRSCATENKQKTLKILSLFVHTLTVLSRVTRTDLKWTQRVTIHCRNVHLNVAISATWITGVVLSDHHKPILSLLDLTLTNLLLHHTYPLLLFTLEYSFTF